MDEQRVRAGNFLFVSYCHTDDESNTDVEGLGLIRRDMNALHATGARLWFDENLYLSDNWRERVKGVIGDARCVGAVFYNSPKAFIQEAMAFERELIVNRANECEGFRYYCVQTNRDTTADMLRQATRLANEDYDKYEMFFDSYRAKIKEWFSDDCIMIREPDDDIRVRRIYQEIIVCNAAVDTAGIVLEDLEKRGIMSKDTNRMEFGLYLDKKSDIKIKQDGEGQRQYILGRTLLCWQSELYETAPLMWTMLFVRDGKTYFICDKSVAVLGADDAERFLRREFCEMAFTENERGFLDSIGLLDVNDFALLCEEKPSFAKLDSYWWVDGQGAYEGWRQAVRRGKLNKIGFPSLLKKGIRPVISISNSKLSEITKNNRG